MAQNAFAGTRVDNDMHEWIRRTAAAEHRAPASLVRVLLIEARQHREATRDAQAQHPGQTALNVDQP